MSTTTSQYEQRLFWDAINIREKPRQIYSNLLHNKTCGRSSKQPMSGGESFGKKNRLTNEWPPGFERNLVNISAYFILFWIIGNCSIEYFVFDRKFTWRQIHNLSSPWGNWWRDERRQSTGSNPRCIKLAFPEWLGWHEKSQQILLRLLRICDHK